MSFIQNSIFCSRPLGKIWTCALLTVLLCQFALPAHAWKNGPPNNKVTNSAKDCLKPPYSTHDWVVDQARLLLPETERVFFDTHRTLLLIGTEAPDYDSILLSCGVPNSGYDDNGGGRHDLRFSNDLTVSNDIAAVRSREEFEKAVSAYRAGRPDHAAYFLGAAAHFIGDLSQYGHTIKGEIHHADFEEWVGGMTPSLNGGGVFEKYIKAAGLVSRTAYEAVILTGAFTYAGVPTVISPTVLDKRYDPTTEPDLEVIVSVGHTLNKAVNETANMLHGFYQFVIKPTQ
ncbi:hypothetical protein N9L49_00350 [Rhodospirillales bacterium]|nr:hypothetical protein [Rhodospirillales bacterium]